MEIKDYGNCQHEWETSCLAPTIPTVTCRKCCLSIEVFKDHVSVWDYGQGVDDPWIGYLFYSKGVE